MTAETLARTIGDGDGNGGHAGLTDENHAGAGMRAEVTDASDMTAVDKAGEGSDIAGQTETFAGRADSAAEPSGTRDLSAIHAPVLLERCVELVAPALSRPGAVVVDCTLGLAGHSLAFLKASPAARLIGIDRDAEALGLATRRLDEAGVAQRFTPVHAPFDMFTRALDDKGVGRVDAAFMDLGLSSLQIDESARGFAYSKDAPLDMRMDPGQSLTAAMILNTYAMEDLTWIMREYGQERFAAPIARAIVRERDREPFENSARLVDLVDRIIPRAHRAPGNPAKRVFQALRIEVNGELDKLASTLPQIALRLNVGGRIVVESYHSLEDTITKRFFMSGLVSEAPAGLPVIPDDMRPFFRDLTHGAIKADEHEREANPRSASVRLRAVELTRPIPDRVARRYERLSDPESGRADRRSGGSSGRDRRHGNDDRRDRGGMAGISVKGTGKGRGPGTGHGPARGQATRGHGAYGTKRTGRTGKAQS